MSERQNDFIIGILAELEFFSELDYQTLSDLSSLFTEKIYNQGEVIFEEDSVGLSMLVIVSGEVRITQRTGVDTEEALIILNKGDVFGEMALVEALPRSASSIAHKNCVLLEITRDDFVEFIHKNPEYGIKILWKLTKILSSRLRETDNKLKTFISLTKWI